MVRAFIVPNLHIYVHGCRSSTPGGDGEMREHELVRCLPFRPQIPRIGPPDLRCVLLPCITRACSRLPNSGPWTEYGPCLHPRSPPGFPAVCPRAGDLLSLTRSSARVYKVRSGRPSPGGDNATGKTGTRTRTCESFGAAKLSRYAQVRQMPYTGVFTHVRPSKVVQVLHTPHTVAGRDALCTVAALLCTGVEYLRIAH